MTLPLNIIFREMKVDFKKKRFLSESKWNSYSFDGHHHCAVRHFDTLWLALRYYRSTIIGSSCILWQRILLASTGAQCTSFQMSAFWTRTLCNDVLSRELGVLHVCAFDIVIFVLHISVRFFEVFSQLSKSHAKDVLVICASANSSASKAINFHPNAPPMCIAYSITTTGHMLVCCFG